MKKILLLGLTTLSTFALMGCDMITGLFEKSYNYNDFKALLADRKLSFKATKATAEIDENGKKSTIEYTLKDGKWTYKDSFGSLEYDSTEDLDVVNYAINCETDVIFTGKKVDEVYKFYAKNDAYRMTAEYKTDQAQVKLEYKFGADGLITYRFEKRTDLSSVETTEKKINYTYSE